MGCQTGLEVIALSRVCTNSSLVVYLCSQCQYLNLISPRDDAVLTCHRADDRSLTQGC